MTISMPSLAKIRRNDPRTLAVAAVAVTLALPAAGWAVSWDAWSSPSDHAAEPRASAPLSEVAPPQVVFDGFGLADFEGVGSVADAIERCDSGRHASEGTLAFKGIDIRGPSGRDIIPAPVAAEVRSRIDKIDVAAGVSASADRLHDGPSQWTGRIGVSNDRATGSESFELRTIVLPNQVASTVGVAVGPRFERKLRRGMTVFIDGQAEAQARHSPDARWWSVPGVADGSLATLGVAARTGIVR
jgi:hypothetical protein